MRLRSSEVVRLCAGRVGLAVAGLAVALSLMAGGAARAADTASALASTPPRLFKICENQTYALCAVASCFVFNGLSYCKCDVKEGDSISLPFDYGRKQDVCTVNAEGKKNGYMVSTYSLPPSAVAPYGNQALYDCPAATSNGAYAQCDGGVCFTGTEGQSFPGFAKPLKKGEIICSCPITSRQSGHRGIGLSDRRPLPVPEIVLPQLHESHRQHQYRLDRLRRRSDRIGPRADPRARRARPAVERMPAAALALTRRTGTPADQLPRPPGAAHDPTRWSNCDRSHPKNFVSAAHGSGLRPWAFRPRT